MFYVVSGNVKVAAFFRFNFDKQVPGQRDLVVNRASSAWNRPQDAGDIVHFFVDQRRSKMLFQSFNICGTACEVSNQLFLPRTDQWFSVTEE